MWPHRPLAGFVVRLLIIYGLLCIPWPGVRRGYAALYRSAAKGLFGSFGSEGVVRFQPAHAEGGRFDSEIVIQKLGYPKFGAVPHDSITTGYLPMTETIALVLATPIPWRRRWKALLYGVLLVYGFVALRVWITLLDGWFSLEQSLAGHTSDPFWSNILARVFEFFFGVNPTCTFFVPVIIWILVTFRKGDWPAGWQRDPRSRPDVGRTAPSQGPRSTTQGTASSRSPLPAVRGTD